MHRHGACLANGMADTRAIHPDDPGDPGDIRPGGIRPDAIQPDDTVAQLAATRAGASRAFARHGIGYCCHGQTSLRAACDAKGLDVDALIREIVAEAPVGEAFERWDQRPLAELTLHLVRRYHEPLRQELPRLLAMAHRVEAVHGDKAACPRGLADLLQRAGDELLLHMQKEEQVLFPLIRAGRGNLATAPVGVMELEHLDHVRTLEQVRALTTDHVPPPEACGTWRALYLGLAELERELVQHMHLENNVLFPRALREDPAGSAS